jgi:hypothetical protein
MRFILFLLLPALLLAFEIHGEVVDAVTKKPIHNAKIYYGNVHTFCDDNGTFSLHTKSHTLFIKAYGYWPYTFDANGTNTLHHLRPLKLKALYLSFWSSSIHSSRFQNILKLAKEKKINAVVVDVKNSSGYISYNTHQSEAKRIGAYKYKMIKNIQQFIDTLHRNNIYVIARIDVFKDALRAQNNQTLALVDENASTDALKKAVWINPYDKSGYKYIISIAKNAAKQGFDEINFDYIRFPADLSLNYHRISTEKTRIQAISRFLAHARNALNYYPVFISADVFGNILWAKDDSNIGQTVPSIIKYVDYLNPMLYPSGFSAGSFMFADPASHPYDVVFRSLKHIQTVVEASRLRPWLQSFRDYAFDKERYGAKQIGLQIQACSDANTSGWMLWNPASRYESKNFIQVHPKKKTAVVAVSHREDNATQAHKTLLSDQGAASVPFHAQ